MREQTDAKPIEMLTADEIEGIYVEGQYKIENIPGYAEASERLMSIFRRVMDGQEVDKEELGKAMAELWILEMTWSMKQTANK